LAWAQRIVAHLALDAARVDPIAARHHPRDPIGRFKEAQREFIGVAGRFDLDPAAKARAEDLREEMKSVAQEIAKHPDRMREAERTGIGRQAEQERGREKGKGLDRDEGLER
jgi:hypothetical protein